MNYLIKIVVSANETKTKIDCFAATIAITSAKEKNFAVSLLMSFAELHEVWRTSPELLINVGNVAFTSPTLSNHPLADWIYVQN